MAGSDEFTAPTVVLVVERPITQAGIAALCARGRQWLERTGASLVVCDVAAIPDPDRTTLEALTRVALTVRQAGWEIRLRHASPRLQDLLRLVGLGDVLPLEDSVLELHREPEQGEHALHIEEVMEAGEPPS